MLPLPSLIETIPNFSEGRDKHTLDALARTASSVPGVTLADYSADPDHNRSVFTLIGSMEGIEEAAFALARTACGYIDLTRHRGEHPRIGAVDVIPFVPLKNALMEDCAALSKRVAARIGMELDIPVYLYGESASADARRNLASIRKGGFEGMAEKMRQPGWMPDNGPSQPHPTAGVTAVGARGPLIAYNINLNTSDITVAKKIAKAIRASDGGLPCCKAIGIMLKSRNITQVSMNMVNYTETPLYRAFEAVKKEAARYGVAIAGSELVGLTPARALADCGAYYMQMENYDYGQQVLENYFLAL
jgi:glutamate formiminotransferase